MLKKPQEMRGLQPFWVSQDFDMRNPLSGVTYGDRWSHLHDGVLTLDHAFTNLHHVEERTQGLIQTLEKGC